MAQRLISSPVKDGDALHRPAQTYRAVVLMAIVTLLLLACVVRLAQLQLVEGVHNRHLAEDNSIRPVPIPSERGKIVDRYGRLLAGNRLTHSLYLWPRQQTPAQWRSTAAQLAPVIGVSSADILAKLQEAGYNSAVPVRVSGTLEPAAFVALEEYTSEIPGLDVRQEFSRYYPYGNLASHVLGYISEATAADLKAHPNYPIGIIIGRMGVERIANQALEGVWGSHLVEVDAAGQPVKLLEDKPPQPGRTVQLTLDLDIQQVAERALDQRRGAVVVMDVKTGGILAMTSGPSFDPNLFTRRITDREWAQLQGRDKPFLNRAVQPYPPGSTFKIAVTTAALQSGRMQPDSLLETHPYLTIGGISFHDLAGNLGLVGFREAIAYSSNSFFYQVGMRTGPENIAYWAKKLGIGTTWNMDLDDASHGYVPTPASKERLFHQPWYIGDTVTMSIGQGLVLATPLELTEMVAVIATKGQRLVPHLFLDQDNAPSMQPTPLHLKPSTLSTIEGGLIEVVKVGTGSSLNDGSIPLTAGKTGTAQVQGEPDNALWVGFGPVSDPQIAMAIIVQGGGFGDVSAVPIAHKIYSAYFHPPAHHPPAPPVHP